MSSAVSRMHIRRHRNNKKRSGRMPKRLMRDHRPEMLLTGLEPVRCIHREILSLLRLPISPQQLLLHYYNTIPHNCQD